MAPSFDAYKIFYFVGRYKNITRTANALFLSQSTVSRSIQGLEQDLGCRLFERSQNGVEFTPRGEMLYSHVARACEQIFAGEDKLLRMQRGLDTVRINISEFFLWQFMLPVLEDFRRSHPTACIELSSHTLGTQQEALADLSSGITDIVCTMAPFAADSRLNAENAASFRDVLIAGPGFEYLRDKTWSLSELINCPFAALVSRESGPNFYDKLFSIRGLEVIPAYKVDTASLLYPLVRKGLCLAFIPSPFLGRIRAEDGVFPVDIKEEMPPQSICVVTEKGAELPPVAGDLIEMIKKYAAQPTAFEKLPG